MTDLRDILSAVQNGVVALNNLATQMQTVTRVTGISTGIPAVGSLSFSSSLAVAFITVTTSSGGTYKLAAYST
jgi:hypothetical protein